MAEQLPQDLSIILNAYQDIEDALLEEPLNIGLISDANKCIGEAIGRLVPN